MWVALILIVLWFACGIIAAGLHFAYFHREFKILTWTRADRIIAWTWGLGFGPIGMVLAFLLGGRAKHGFKWPWSAPDKDKPCP